MSAVGEVIKSVVAGAVAPIANIFVKKTERKQAKDKINGQVELAKIEGKSEVAVQTADWEILSKAQEEGSWKDEYVTLSVFTIFNGVIVGSVASAFGYEGGAELVNGILEGVRTIDALDGTVGTLIIVTAYAALSIKVVKDVFK